MKPLAVLCKFYNEPAHLPLWLDHYGRQAGLENCYLLDHGTDDGSQLNTGRANVVRLQRSAQDDDRHLALIRLFSSQLLKRYRYVLHVDMDEFVVADPERHGTLTDFAASCERDVVSMIGLQLQQVPAQEPAFDMARSVLAQRRHVWFLSSMCKPALTRGPLDWSPGFHCMREPTVFDDLYLYHLRWFDRDIGLRRLHRSRNQPWSHPDQALHQRHSDEEWLVRFADFGASDRLSDIPAEQASPDVREHLDAVIASRSGREQQNYRIDLSIRGLRLWRIPERFATIF